MLDKVKLALRISTDAYNDELNDLIDAALADLGVAGVVNHDTSDPLICRAVITYCRLNFGSPADFDRLQAAYNGQKGQLASCTGYTSWE